VCQSLDGTCCQRVIATAAGEYSSSLEPLTASGLQRGTNAPATPRCTGIAPSKGCAKCAYGGRQEGKTIFDCTGSGLNLPAYNDGRRPFGARYTCADGSERESDFRSDGAAGDSQSGRGSGSRGAKSWSRGAKIGLIAGVASALVAVVAAAILLAVVLRRRPPPAPGPVLLKCCGK
jgi:hypothetical protein